MPLFKRPDGVLVTDVPPVRRIMPYIMPTRTQSAVYFEQQVDLSKTQPFIDAFNASHDKRITVFHVFLWAALRTLASRPRLNRFVSGGRVYQRDGIWLSFSAKKALSDDAPIVTLKRLFDPSLDFEQLVSFVYGDVSEGRSDKKSHVDKELSFFLALPGALLRVGVSVLRWLDSWNLLPGSYIRGDPLYTSMFVANLGSVRLESAYHHLYEYGNCPLFAAIGKKRREVVVDASGNAVTKLTCSIKYSFDERIEDGLYCARGLELLRTLVEDPAANGARAGLAQVVPLARAG